MFIYFFPEGMFISMIGLDLLLIPSENKYLFVHKQDLL